MITRDKFEMTYFKGETLPKRFDVDVTVDGTTAALDDAATVTMKIGGETITLTNAGSGIVTLDPTDLADLTNGVYDAYLIADEGDGSFVHSTGKVTVRTPA
ncbi:hypothetical protein ACLB6G_20280 [Zhengella sp. ZM62]|uniref:hypothetical protein n=1 Tax=Zhengella sedimenti TaxID=3390035 RepID=UPI003975C955